MKPLITSLSVMLGILLLLPLSLQAQQDTSSYFPLGLWAIWIDHARPPFTPMSLNEDQWNRERLSWQQINANYMVAWIPVWVEDTVMTQTEPMGYKLDIGRSTHGYPGQVDTSLRAWIHQASNPPSVFWKRRAGEKIKGISQTFGSRPGFYSYFVAHEADFWRYNLQDTAWWPAIGNIIDSIKQIDPTHKSYVVHWGSRGVSPFPFGITLAQFAQRFANLGIYEVDDYVFLSDTPPTYNHQQTQIDLVLSSYHDCMVSFRNGTTDWHAVIQSQRDFRNEFCPNYLRRPNPYELRVQAYLALSRGARGITSFLYGSYPPGGGDDPPNPTDLLLGVPENQCDITGYAGLVDVDRIPYDIGNPDPEGIPGFTNLATVHNELKPLGPTVRKLRVYDAFPNTTIPQSNIASITSVSGDKIEIGVFKRVDEGADSTVYFMLVNRVCNLENGDVSDPQSVSLTFNHPTFQSLLITEVASGEAWVIPSQGTFSTVLDPGSGKFFRMENAVISAARTFPQGLTVLGGATLTAVQHAQLSFGPGTSLTISGTLIVNGSSENMVTLSSATPPNHWSGITVTGVCNQTVEIEYAEISHATVALTITDRAYLTLANSSIENCDIGLQIVPSLANCPQIIPPKYVTSNTFSNVTLGISLNTSAVTYILSNMITGSDVGISLSNPTYAIMDGNVVRENSIGISISGCGPVLHSNLIEENSDYGVWVSDFADPRFGDMVSNDPGHNIIRNNNRPDAAQIAALTGFPFFGCHEEWCGEEMGGYNSIYYDLDKGEFRYAIEAREKSDVLAHIGWWGVYPADPRLFLADESSNIDYRFELDYDPNGGNGPSRPGFAALKLTKGLDGGEPPSMLSLTPDQRLLLQALGLRGRHQYTEALALYVQLILTRPLRPEALVAVSQLRNCYRDYVRHSGQPQLHEQLLQYLSTQSSGHSNPRLRTIAKFLLAQEYRVAGQSYIAAQMFSDLATANQNTALETSALYSLFGILAFDLGNREEAAAVFNTLESRYPTDPRTHIARIQYNAILAGGSNASFQRSGNTSAMQRTLSGLPKEFALHQNYPNPFNPTTRISFSLPEDIRTVLKVYDLLGREIQTLVDEFTKAGDHTVDFDASRLASGMYLYRLQAGPFSQTSKMILLR